MQLTASLLQSEILWTSSSFLLKQINYAEGFITVFNILGFLAKTCLKDKYCHTRACTQEFLLGNNTSVKTSFFLSAIIGDLRGCPQGQSVFLFQMPLKVYICK